MQILYLEDDRNDAFLFSRALTRLEQSASVQSVEDGGRGMQYLTGQGEYADRERYPIPQLVLMDLKMPRVNGFEFLQWLKANPLWRYLPVVVWTSSGEKEDIQQCYRLGAASYLVKPLEMHELITQLAVVIHYWTLCNHATRAETGL